MNLRLLCESHGGEGGIRTPGGRSSRPQRFSRPPPSTTQPPLHYFVSVSLKRRHRVKVEYFSRRTFERHPTKDLHFKGHPKRDRKAEHMECCSGKEPYGSFNYLSACSADVIYIIFQRTVNGINYIISN